MITNEVAKCIDKFTSVGSLINPGGLMAGEISARVILYYILPTSVTCGEG